MTAVPATPPTEQVFGIAKKMSLELEKTPLHTHAAVITMMNTMVQHRKMALDMEVNQAQIAAQEAAMADARKAHADRQVKEDARIAEQIAKPPRQMISLEPNRMPASVENVTPGVITEPEYEQVTGG